MKTIKVKYQELGSYNIIDVRRNCRMEDLEARYIVTKQIMQDGQEDGFYDQHFDEFFCQNCGYYDIDWEANHVSPN